MKKTVKKATPKARAKTTKNSTSRKVTKPVTTQNVNVKIDKEKLKKFSQSAFKIVGLLLILLLVDFFVQYLNNDYSVAIVNGQRIPKREYIQNLENTYGAQIAEMMVQEELAKQLGKEKGIEIDQKEVEEAYEKIAEQIGGEEALQEALETNNMTKEKLEEQLKSELVLKKIIEPTLEYTDEDLNEFFEEYKEFIYEGQEDVKFEDKRDEVEEYYVEQKTFEGRDTILAEFRESVSIQINVAGANDEDISYGPFKATRNLISNFVAEKNTN